MHASRHVSLGLWLLLVAPLSAPAQERIIFQKDSPYSRIVVTEDDRGLRTLRFDTNGVRQSVVNPSDPDYLELAYARVVPVGLAVVDRPQRVLVVGLGGGTIPRFLRQHYPTLVIDAVDIDPEVVAVAKQFFGFREDPRLHAHVDDGRAYIEKNVRWYDIIFLDAFSADSIPYHLATREFLVAVRRALTPQGIVVSNVWSRDSNELYDSMVRTYQDVFEQLYVVDIQASGNKILLAVPRPGSVERDVLARRASEISTQRGFRFDLGEAVRFGFRLPGDDGAQGRILTDQEKPSDK